MDISFETLQVDLENAKKFRERRHQQWTENNLLYRDTVITNRLTQRQSVNAPLMKEVVRTSLAINKDFPDLYYEDYGNDGQRELFLNEYWTYVFNRNKILLIDEIDRKQQALYGRSYIAINIVNGEVVFEVKDPFDILVDRHANPWDIDSATSVIDMGIIVPLSKIQRNAMYDKEAVRKLESFFASKQGLIKADETRELYEEKMKRLSDLGVSDAAQPAPSETFVQIQMHQKKVWDEEKKEIVTMVLPVAGDQVLMQKPMKEILGVNRYNIRSWADDLERIDWYSDGMADIVRQPNHILNAWLSQMTENRTLRNFGMQFYDSTKTKEWNPSTFTPDAWGFYPFPGNPNEGLKRVEVPDLSEALDEMEYVKKMAQSATAATSIETGAGDDTDRTLGEIQILAARANKRLTYTGKFHKQYWGEIGELFSEIVNANAAELNPVKLYKKGASGRWYPKVLSPSQFASKEGYRCRITSKNEKEADALQSIQKLRIVSAEFPMNAPLQEIKKEKMLGLLDLTPDEKKQVMDAEDQMPIVPGMTPGMPGMTPSPLPTSEPVNATL